MNSTIEYKGYQALIEYSVEDSVLYGKVLDIDDKIIFEIERPSDAAKIFKDVIDDYLELCRETNKEPNKPYKGVFNVRIAPDLHKKAVRAARSSKVSLNSFVESAIRERVEHISETKGETP
ncbi:MAG: type II toxin-antitoxin system HicB family antitoxin [Ruminiclostridium sp.]|nr:type II toxin-antitoxin system HicB family antitoxin [Ruminiclostridium sp.]